MVKSFSFACLLAIANWGYSFDLLPKQYLITVGSDHSKNKATEYFSLSCPTCLRLIKSDFETIFNRYIRTGKVCWTFHPDPQDLTTLRFMVCLEDIPQSKRFSFFWEIVHVVQPGADKRNCLILQEISRRYHNPVPNLANLDFLEKTRAANCALSYLKQDGIPEKIPAIAKNGKLLKGFPILKKIREHFGQLLSPFKGAKDHCIDAAYVGEEGRGVFISSSHFPPLHIKAMGRGSRQIWLSDKFGFPRTKAKSQKAVRGFKTGDFVKAIVLKGKNKGTYLGMVAVRSTGNFCLRTPVNKVDGINAKHCSLAQKSLGRTFSFEKTKPALLPPARARGIRALEVL